MRARRGIRPRETARDNDSLQLIVCWRCFLSSSTSVDIFLHYPGPRRLNVTGYAAHSLLPAFLGSPVRHLLLCLAALALSPPQGAVGESAHRSLPCQAASPLGTGQTEWKQIQLDGGQCAFETPYRLYYRRGSEPDRL